MKKKPSILVIDIGNSSTSLGLFESGRVRKIHRIEKVNQTASSIAETIYKTTGQIRPDGVCIASVVPSLNSLWQKVIRQLLQMNPLWVNHRLNLGIKIRYPKPETIGADRLANAVGGLEKYGAPVIICDYGTATTFDVVTVKQGYIGGVIAPGPMLMVDYLAERTAQLPRITWKPTKKNVGKSTVEAMQLGAQWGYRGLVREILHELTSNPALKRVRIIATGGFADKVLKGQHPRPLMDPQLTLFGIGCIYLNNT